MGKSGKSLPEKRNDSAKLVFQTASCDLRQKIQKIFCFSNNNFSTTTTGRRRRRRRRRVTICVNNNKQLKKRKKKQKRKSESDNLRFVQSISFLFLFTLQYLTDSLQQQHLHFQE